MCRRQLGEILRDSIIKAQQTRASLEKKQRQFKKPQGGCSESLRLKKIKYWKWGKQPNLFKVSLKLAGKAERQQNKPEGVNAQSVFMVPKVPCSNHRAACW